MTKHDPCPHITLKRKNVGNQHWHQCEACRKKFLAKEWDGKVAVIENGWKQELDALKSKRS